MTEIDRQKFMEWHKAYGETSDPDFEYPAWKAGRSFQWLSMVEELHRLQAVEAERDELRRAAIKIDWRFVEDIIRNPGDYTWDEKTANAIKRFAALLEQP